MYIKHVLFHEVGHHIDWSILDWFKSRVEEQGGGNYQSMINDALRSHIESKDGSMERICPGILRAFENTGIGLRKRGSGRTEANKIVVR